ncbi:MAG: carotenoid oxygenase family protein [Gammaproteobacteria bacterium]|nr:carotenoid oxygenase family protein [Gammaproteobacteria bacterium]
MIKIFLGFLPWILYFLLIGKTREQNLAAILVALLVTVLVDFDTLKKRFVLTWGTILFFIGLFLSTIFVSSNWPEKHASIMANGALMMIAWTSLLINKPFTLQYAKLEVPERYWQMPGFLFVNQIITLVWCISFTVMTALSYYKVFFNPMLYNILSYTPTFLAIWFTAWYPDWYKGYRFRILTQDKEDPTKNSYLQGNYAPITSEIEATHLQIEGALPKGINGVYIRNGPNPLFPQITYTYPIDGDGMLHAFYLRDGVASYRNRFVETKGLIAEKKAGHALYGGIRRAIPPDPKLIGKEGDPGPVKDGASIHVIPVANKILAMYEAGIAYEVRSNLQTIGPWCPKGAESPFNVNAHTRNDAKTKECFAFTYNLEAPYLQYYALDQEGALTRNIPIEKPYSSMMHDFVVTENYIVFFDCPAIFDDNNLIKGGALLQWKPEIGVHIILVHRKTNQVTSIETDPFFVYHFANGYEENGKIIVDYVRHEKLFLGGEARPSKPPTLYRAIIDYARNSVQHVQLNDLRVEFPRINDNFQTTQSRYIYLPTTINTQNASEFHAMLKYDTQNQSSIIHDFGEQAEIGEAVFIPENNAKSEDAGYLGLFVYDKPTKSSSFVLLHAQAMSEKPIACIPIPQRVPHGLHGSWITHDDTH